MKFGLTILIAIIAGFAISGVVGLMTPSEPESTPVKTVSGTSQQLSDTLLATNAYIKSTIPGIKVSSGYVTLTNQGTEPLVLIGAETTQAKHTEFHRMFLQNSRMAMRKVDKVEIPAGETFVFKPNDFHFMFMGLSQQFKSGETIDVDLISISGERYTVSMPIMDVKSTR